jgi:hypothetical protein
VLQRNIPKGSAFGVFDIDAASFLIGLAAAVIDTAEEHGDRSALAIGIDPMRLVDFLKIGGLISICQSTFPVRTSKRTAASAGVIVA